MDPGSGETIGRGWPLLTGERGEYELADIAEAHRFVDTGRKRGNVVVRIAADEPAQAPSSTEQPKEASS